MNAATVGSVLAKAVAAEQEVTEDYLRRLVFARRWCGAAAVLLLVADCFLLSAVAMDYTWLCLVGYALAVHGLVVVCMWIMAYAILGVDVRTDPVEVRRTCVLLRELLFDVLCVPAFAASRRNNDAASFLIEQYRTLHGSFVAVLLTAPPNLPVASVVT